VFFVEAHYQRNAKRAADQVRYIANREEGLRDGQRRDLYGVGPRYRAFRGDERAIRKGLVQDARGLRNPVYFRFTDGARRPAAGDRNEAFSDRERDRRQIDVRAWVKPPAQECSAPCSSCSRWAPATSWPLHGALVWLHC
jgi:hypothetical protein